MKEKEYDKWLITGTIKMFLTVFSWLMLFAAVIYIGFTIGLTVMYIIKGSGITDNIIAFMMNVLGGYNLGEVDELIAANGVNNVAIGAIGYGFAMSFTYSLAHVLFSKFINLFDSIVNGEMFTKKNVDMINDCVPLTVLFALTQPVLIFIISSVTGVYDTDDVIISGILFVFVNYTLKLIFEKGYALTRSENKLDRITSDVKAKEEEYSVELLKKENQIKTLKEENKALKEENESLKVKEAPVKKEVKEPKKVTPAKKEQPAPKPHKKFVPKKQPKKEVKKATK